MIPDPKSKTGWFYDTALFQLGENQSILFSVWHFWLKKLRWYYVLWFSPVIRWAFTLYCAHKDTWCSSITLRSPASHLSHAWFNRVSGTIILPNGTLIGPSFIQLNIQYASIGELPNQVYTSTSTYINPSPHLLRLRPHVRMGSPIHVGHEVSTFHDFLYLRPLFLICQRSIFGVYHG